MSTTPCIVSFMEGSEVAMRVKLRRQPAGKWLLASSAVA